MSTLVPGASSESDVHRLFGKPTSTLKNEWTYKTPKGSLEVTYSTGECESRFSAYKFEKGTVIYIWFDLKDITPIEKFDQDLENFSVEKSSDTQNETYINASKGIKFGTVVLSKDREQYDKSPRYVQYILTSPLPKFSQFECLY